MDCFDLQSVFDLNSVNLTNEKHVLFFSIYGWNEMTTEKNLRMTFMNISGLIVSVPLLPSGCCARLQRVWRSGAVFLSLVI